MISINLVFEDDLSEAVMIRLLDHFGDKYRVVNTYPGYGFGYLKSNIRGFNQASIITPFFMLTDLDLYSCPLKLIQDWVSFPINKGLIFRIAVREVESWLLADIEALSLFLRVSKANFPLQPEYETDPKRKLIQIAKKSRLRRIREDIVPINENAVIGPNYNGCLIEFVYEKWNIKRASQRSRSLEKALIKLDLFQG